MVPLMQYSREEWGITYPEYQMLLQAREQRIVDKRDIDRARYHFLWGDMTVREFISRADYRHTFETDIWPVRDTITQEEFEHLCYEVLEYMGEISVRHSGPSLENSTSRIGRDLGKASQVGLSILTIMAKLLGRSGNIIIGRIMTIRRFALERESRKR